MRIIKCSNLDLSSTKYQKLFQGKAQSEDEIMDISQIVDPYNVNTLRVGIYSAIVTQLIFCDSFKTSQLY